MSKEHAYAYEAGYRDGSVHYELEHCPACKNIADLQATLDENAKLREEIELVGTAGYLLAMKQLKAENAKLRELAAKMAKALRVGSEWCDRECSAVFGCDGMDECHIVKELHELGIEVN